MQLPAGLGGMQRLQYVNAADNDLDAIPSEARAAATCDIINLQPATL